MLTVEGPFAEALMLETHPLDRAQPRRRPSPSAGARMVDAAAGPTLIEGGARRTHEGAAPAAARAAPWWASTSRPTWRPGAATACRPAAPPRTRSSSAHDDELAAFAAQVAAFTGPTTYLVDTYDVEQGIRNAVAAGRHRDSVPSASTPATSAAEAVRARRPARRARRDRYQIVVSGDLDEQRIAALAAAPVDRYLVGTHLVTGSGAPDRRAGVQARGHRAGSGTGAVLEPVEKTSPGKESHGGRKVAARELDATGHAVAERVWRVGEDRPDLAGGRRLRALQVPLWREGRPVPAPDLEANAAGHHRQAKDELWAIHRQLLAGPPAFDGTPMTPAPRA